ncbi:MAG TPA: VOC family protein [Actinopolymorphaceae bacterium]|jgi:catechol 2,3-dioxygenase-like lactoylglutathione lyase family enzyme
MTPRFDLVGLVVADMSASLAFYRALGLDIPTSADTEPHVEIVLPGGIRLAWDTIDVVRSFDPGWEPPTGGPGITTAFLVDSHADVDSTHDAAVAAGYAAYKAPWDAFWGQRYAVLIDPDGNHVDVFAQLPGTSP